MESVTWEVFRADERGLRPENGTHNIFRDACNTVHQLSRGSQSSQLLLSGQWPRGESQTVTIPWEVLLKEKDKEASKFGGAWGFSPASTGYPATPPGSQDSWLPQATEVKCAWPRPLGGGWDLVLGPADQSTAPSPWLL